MYSMQIVLRWYDKSYNEQRKIPCISERVDIVHIITRSQPLKTNSANAVINIIID